MNYINPVFWFDETEKLIEAGHNCQHTTSLTTNILNSIVNQYWRLLLELRNAVNFWTDNKPNLASEPVEKQQNVFNLISTEVNTSNWISRIQNYGRATLDDSELLVFLLTSGIQAYNCFKISAESQDSDHGYYLLYIRKPARS